MSLNHETALVDPLGRHIDYLRLSVTDRCDFRCTYCMAEEMTFLPRREVLSLEEIARIARVFIQLGVRKIRVTGGEPLVRRDISTLFDALGSMAGLKELAVTTNGSQLQKLAPMLKRSGVTTLNISLDTLDPGRFRKLTRTGDLALVLSGVDAAIAAGFDRIRLNAVILAGQNETDILPLLDYAIQRDVDIAFIEEMPLGQVNAAGKPLEFVANQTIYERIAEKVDLTPVAAQSHSGPARYWQLSGHRTRLGLISPHTGNFCASCNRLRVTAEGNLLLCLGNENAISLRDLLRSGYSDEQLAESIHRALLNKPAQHVFDQPHEPQILRFMNASGG
ncbi:MAG: GTP 3',8-cyclase MoaA [Proteobacteria bacterium]|jgi:cyclic pyranopterin phosphate synthase|nr:GTP 3',8-cyclase MoaA [Pseudomonadota bacterium]